MSTKASPRFGPLEEAGATNAYTEAGQLDSFAAGRLVIYFFYDPDGVVDDYVFRTLNSLSNHCAALLFVSNGTLVAASRSRLEQIGASILERANEGMDAMAYKEALQYLGEEKLRKLDELIMMNYTIAGPVGSLDDMFNTMAKEDVDFWGLTVHNGASFDPWGLSEHGYIPLHLQSHFLAVRSSMLNGADFKAYWDDLPDISTYEQSVSWHEIRFTGHFESRGYRWASFVDTQDLIGKCFYPLFNFPVEMIRDRRSPFFKRKLFIAGADAFLQENDHRPARELYDFLRETEPDVLGELMPHLARTAPPEKITSTIGLVELIAAEGPAVENTKRFPLIIRYDQPDLLDDITSVLLSDLPTNIDARVEFYDPPPGLREDPDGISIPNTSRVPDYGQEEDIILVVDLRGKDASDPRTNFTALLASLRRNLYDSSGYVDRIATAFRDQPWLGLISTVPSVHGPYLHKNWATAPEVGIFASGLDGGYWVRSSIGPADAPLDAAWIEATMRSERKVVGLAVNSRSATSIIVNQAHIGASLLTGRAADAEQLALRQQIDHLESILQFHRSSLGFTKYTVYFDRGQGYDESDSVKGEFILGEGETYIASFSVPSGTLRVRFDPYESGFCIVDGVMVQPPGLRITAMNGIADGNMFIFLTGDPQLEISGKFGREPVVTVIFRGIAVAPIATRFLDELGPALLRVAGSRSLVVRSRAVARRAKDLVRRMWRRARAWVRTLRSW